MLPPMRKRLSILIPVLLVVILAGICIWIVHSAGPQPVYQGKPLDYWLTGFDFANSRGAKPQEPPPPSWNEAGEAVRQMGTNAVPTLLRMLQARDSKFKDSVISLLRKQHIFKPPEAAVKKNIKALHAFTALGPKGAPAVPALIKMYEQDSSSFSQQGVPMMLANMGSAAEPAIPLLVGATTHTNEYVRNNAIFALGGLHMEPKLVVPALIRCLNDSNAMVQAQAAGALASYGKDARSTFPVLLELWKNTPYRTAPSGAIGLGGTFVSWQWGGGRPSWGTPNVADAVKKALQSIDPEAAAKAGVQ